MKTVGIIAEYNPFHNGHKYQMQEARRVTGADAVAVVLSGEFVQRGEPSIVPKDLRAKWALQNGADIVFELPVTCSLGNAMAFARGSVGIFHATGIINYLCFGSETTDINALYEALAFKQNESEELQRALWEGLSLGMSYPRALHRAYALIQAPDAILSILAKPNSILGLEYLNALSRLSSPIQPVPILRKDADHHDQDLGKPIASASAIRKGLLEQDQTAHLAVPDNVSRDLLLEQRLLSFFDLNDLLLYELSRHTESSLKEFEDMTEGFERLLLKALDSSPTLFDLLSALKSKRYTMARIKRLLSKILLGIDRTLGDLEPQYIRVLGMRQSTGPLLLKELREQSTLPVIVSGKDLESLSADGKRQFHATERAARVISILSQKPHVPEKSRRLIVV